MLELLFAAALMDTVIAEPQDGTVYVHEWGVVTFSQETVTFGADPSMMDFVQPYDPDQWEDAVVRAPVVYFYGEPFSGSFYVNAAGGSFIETWPEPDSTMQTGPITGEGHNTAQWQIDWSIPGNDRDGAGAVDAISCISEELLELWCKPPSMLLGFRNGLSGKFIYYECSLQPVENGYYYPVVYGPEGVGLSDSYQDELLSFVKTPSGVTMLNPPDGEIVELLCDWAGGTMKSQELEAMWLTWEDWIRQGSWQGDTLQVFPLSETTVDNITTISLATDGYQYVEYSRFFLGMLSY
jgi:hypothetical protein